MNFTILFIVGLVAYFAAESHLCFIPSDTPPLPRPPPISSEEGIYGHETQGKLNRFKKAVYQLLIGTTRDILTDGIHISPTKQVVGILESALHKNASLESVVHISGGVIEATGDLFLQRAAELAAQRAAESGLSKERLTGFGDISVFHEVEQRLHAQYNSTVTYGGPSHEGVQAGLGAITIEINGRPHQTDKYIPNQVYGHLFYVTPQFPISKEGIIPAQPSEEGILSSAGKLILKGAGKFAREILQGVFGPISKVLQNIFLARGSFSRFPTIQAAAHELIHEARLKLHQSLPFEARHCLDDADRRFTLLFKDFEKNGHACVAAAHPHSRRIINHVQDIVLDAVRRVEDAHHEIEFCFGKYVEENRIICLNKDVSNQIDEHTRKIERYGEELADFVKKFSDLNTGFDVCLVGHLGIIRREIYQIDTDFQKCVSLRPVLGKRIYHDFGGTYKYSFLN